jgi:predicted ArsR family transcriptional regulator
VVQIMLSLPPRRYDLVGEILVDAMGQPNLGGQPVNAARRVAFESGRQIGASRREELRRGRVGAERTIAEAGRLLEKLGFEPAEAQGGLVLRNCPFHALAQRDPELVCGLNVSFVDGMLRGLGNTTVTADLRAEDGLCCVQLWPPGGVRADDQVGA